MISAISRTSVLREEGWSCPAADIIGTLVYCPEQTDLTRLCTEYNLAYAYNTDINSLDYDGNLTSALTHFVNRVAETLAPKRPKCYYNGWGLEILDSNNTDGGLEGEMDSYHDVFFARRFPFETDQGEMPKGDEPPWT